MKVYFDEQTIYVEREDGQVCVVESNGNCYTQLRLPDTAQEFGGSWDDGYAEGYDAGQNDGYGDGYSDAEAEAYDREEVIREEEYSQGYSDGYEAAKNEEGDDYSG